MKWELLQSDERTVTRLAENMGIHPVIATLLVNRGITEPSRARSFLASDLADLSDPNCFSQMAQAVKRIKDAIAQNEKITIYGDYDVDGVTGSALLFLVLRDMGAEVAWYIPDRMTEGYGLNAPALERIRKSGGRLVVSVDCGIGALGAASRARELGLDLIITDHHEFRDALPTREGDPMLPEACAIIHPELLVTDLPPGTREAVGGITGVGVAFKLAHALTGTGPDPGPLVRYLDLVTLGTIADVGRITGENRIFVKHGLQRLSSTEQQRPGIAALKQAAGLSGKTISAGIVGFTIAPRINASGRMEHADAAFRLLTTDSEEEARRIARDLENVNRERQRVEERIHEEARKKCREADLDSTGAFVLASSDWHPGVIGIVASRIVEEFYRPAALISVKEGIGKGSARSIPGFDLYGGLKHCADLLSGFGGHTYAAGFTVAEERIPELRDRLGSFARERMGAGGFVKKLAIDGSVKLLDLTLPLMQDLELMAPFGLGNPEPRLGARALTVISARTVGNNHLKLKLRQEKGIPFDAIAFNRSEELGRTVRGSARIAAVFTPRLNRWNGTTGIELEIRDVKAER